MNDKDLEKQLKTLHYIHPSERLKDRITELTADLPSHSKTFFPLVAFQMGVAFAVILLLLGIGSGVVAAASYSRPGNFFYPVRKVIEGLPIKVFHEEIPTLTPVPTQRITPRATPEVKKEKTEKNLQDKEHEQENEDTGISSQQKVEGITTQSPVVSPSGENNGDGNVKKVNFGDRIKQFFNSMHIQSFSNHGKENK